MEEKELAEGPPQFAMYISSQLSRHPKQLFAEKLRGNQSLKMFDDVFSLHVTYEQEKRVNCRHKRSAQHTPDTEHATEKTIRNKRKKTNTKAAVSIP